MAAGEVLAAELIDDACAQSSASSTSIGWNAWRARAAIDDDHRVLRRDEHFRRFAHRGGIARRRAGTRDAGYAQLLGPFGDALLQMRVERNAHRRRRRVMAIL